MELSDRAANVLSLLLMEPDLQEGELIFVGHSLGGLVIKQVLRKAADAAPTRADAYSLVDRTRKVAFLATPHLGADLAGWGDWLRILIRSSAATRSLLRNDSHLRDLNLWYRNWTTERKIDHLILVETKTTSVFGMVVKRDSSDPGLSRDPIPIDADHITIAKPPNPNDQIYRLVRSFIDHEVERPVSREEKKLDEILAHVAGKENVPLETLRALLAEMGEAAPLADPKEIEQKLKDKAKEFKELTERLNRLSNADPEVLQLRQAAATALSLGRFVEADGHLAAAEARDLAGLEDLEAFAKVKRLSAAESRSERAAAAMLRVNSQAYAEAVAHYAEAARMAATADAMVARDYAEKQGQSLVALGSEFGRNSALLEAIAHFRRLLSASSQRDDPLQWALTQMNLGNALCTLGERESGTGRLEEAVAAYRAALTECAQERAPLQWATTQMNLGIVLRALGERESGTGRLEEAVAAYRAALTEWTQEGVPLQWATAQMNLGNALSTLGEREGGTGRLEEAVAAYRAALTERTQERDPLQWATTQNNLGNALFTLGGRESGTGRLEEAIAAHRAALTEWTQERVPLQWATTQMNLGNALSTLGERESGTGRLEEAVAAYRAALTERTQERAPHQWAATQMNFGNALRALGERESGTGRLEEAVAAYRAALTEWTQERIPLLWAMTQNNLGNALFTLGERESGTGRLVEAVAAYRAALTERTQEGVPLHWAATQNNLGNALVTLGERESGTGRLEEAVAAYREALKELTRKASPHDHDMAQRNLDRASALLAQRQKK
jgi:tetratricopeptide (TPR) repeat protein